MNVLITRPMTSSTEWTSSRYALTLGRPPSTRPEDFRKQQSISTLSHSSCRCMSGPWPALAQTTAIMADAVRLGTASAFLHRYLKTEHARPYLPRFRSRVQPFDFLFPRTTNRLPPSQPTLTSERKCACQHEKCFRRPCFDRDELAIIDWRQ